jgi:hypothetical protein
MTDRDRLAGIKAHHDTWHGRDASYYRGPEVCNTCWLIAEVERLREREAELREQRDHWMAGC